MSNKWEDLSFIIRSRYRRKIFLLLYDKIATPTLISKASGIRINHVSNVLLELDKRGFVKCLNPSDKKGRLYQLTDKGRKFYDYVNSINELLSDEHQK